MVAALIEACAWCEAPENRDELVALLARPEYVNAPAEALRMSMCGRYDFGLDRVEDCPGFNIFARGDANEPTAEKAAWVLQGFIRAGLAEREQLPAGLATRCFRADLHAQARTLLTDSQITAA
jgi:NitT/TauT family transport system ATP-binding protein